MCIENCGYCSKDRSPETRKATEDYIQTLFASHATCTADANSVQLLLNQGPCRALVEDIWEEWQVTPADVELVAHLGEFASRRLRVRIWLKVVEKHGSWYKNNPDGCGENPWFPMLSRVAIFGEDNPFTDGWLVRFVEFARSMVSAGGVIPFALMIPSERNELAVKVGMDWLDKFLERREVVWLVQLFHLMAMDFAFSNQEAMIQLRLDGYFRADITWATFIRWATEFVRDLTEEGRLERSTSLGSYSIQLKPDEPVDYLEIGFDWRAGVVDVSSEDSEAMSAALEGVYLYGNPQWHDLAADGVV